MVQVFDVLLILPYISGIPYRYGQTILTTMSRSLTYMLINSQTDRVNSCSLDKYFFKTYGRFVLVIELLDFKVACGQLLSASLLFVEISNTFVNRDFRKCLLLVLKLLLIIQGICDRDMSKHRFLFLLMVRIGTIVYTLYNQK